MLVKPSTDNFLITWRRSGGSEQSTNMTRKRSWVMAAVADLNEESLMDKSELNFRCQARTLELHSPEAILLDYKTLPSVCGNLSQLLTIRP
jgi:hypothetical protein